MKIVGRGRGFWQAISIQYPTVRWVLEKVSEVGSWACNLKYARMRRDGRRVVVIQLKENNRGRYLLISSISEEGQAQSVVFPKGKKGYGWKNVVTAMSDLLGELEEKSIGMQQKELLTSSLNLEKIVVPQGTDIVPWDASVLGAFPFKANLNQVKVGAEMVCCGNSLGIKTFYLDGVVSSSVWGKVVVAFQDSDAGSWEECGRLVKEFLQCQYVPDIRPVDEVMALIFLNSLEDSEQLARGACVEASSVELICRLGSLISKLLGSWSGKVIQLKFLARWFYSIRASVSWCCYNRNSHWQRLS